MLSRTFTNIQSCESEVKTAKMSPQLEELYDYYSDQPTDSRDWNDWREERQKQISDNFISIFLIFLLLCVILWLVHLLKRCILQRKQKLASQARSNSSIETVESQASFPHNAPSAPERDSLPPSYFSVVNDVNYQPNNLIKSSNL